MPGDTIQTPQLWGQVKRIGIRSSTVRTWEGAEVIVPNSDLVLMQVTNWTLSDRQRRIEIDLGIAYGSDPTAVVQLLVEVAKANDEILESPNPYALFMGFGESSLDFSLRAWTVKFDDFLRIKSDLTIAVNDALVRNGFVIPFPQRDVHVKSPHEDAKMKHQAQDEEMERREARTSTDLPPPDTSGPDTSGPDTSETDTSGPDDGSME
jgi:small-conductance mechanosensitive channel